MPTRNNESVKVRGRDERSIFRVRFLSRKKIIFEIIQARFIVAVTTTDPITAKATMRRH